MLITSRIPEAIRVPTDAAGRSRATASPVTRSSGESIPNSGDGIDAEHRVHPMDLDAYVLAHRAEWDRLEALSRQRRLDGRESDELVERYQRGATPPSGIRPAAPDGGGLTHLSPALSRPRHPAGGR